MEYPPHHFWHIPEAACWATVVLLLLLAPLYVKPALSNRPLEWLGMISYSVYITHLPLIAFGLAAARTWRPAAFVGWGATAAAAVGLILVGCLSLSVLTYRTIERPFLVRKARIST